MSDREDFERYARTWLWMGPWTLDRLGYSYIHPAVQFAYQCLQEGRRGGFVSSAWVDIELPLDPK